MVGIAFWLSNDSGASVAGGAGRSSKTSRAAAAGAGASNRQADLTGGRIPTFDEFVAVASTCQAPTAADMPFSVTLRLIHDAGRAAMIETWLALPVRLDGRSVSPPLGSP